MNSTFKNQISDCWQFPPVGVLLDRRFKNTPVQFVNSFYNVRTFHFDLLLT